MNAPTRPEVLARIDALPITARSFCEAVGVSPAFVSKARSGGCAGPKSERTWQKLLEGLRGAERPPAEKAADAVQASRQEAPARSGSVPADLVEFSEAIDKARSAESLEQLNRLAMQGIAEGWLSENAGRALAPLISRAQQLLELRLQQEAVAKAGDEVVVRVILVRGWTGGPLPG